MNSKNQIENENLFDGMSKESFEFLGRAFLDAALLEIRELEEKTQNMEIPPPSKRQKKRMNRLFRERVGGSFLPYPEVDSFYERIRSKLVIKLKINKILDRYKQI